MKNEENIENYSKDYSEKSFWEKVKTTFKSAGLSLVYKALQLFYVAQNPNCPAPIKAGIYAALGYFISPIDFIPDFTPMVGYADDAGAIATALTVAQIYIDDSVKEKAKKTIRSIFGDNVADDLD